MHAAARYGTRLSSAFHGAAGRQHGLSTGIMMAASEPVLDVPAKLSARARGLSTGNGRKTDPVDAHSVALVALRTPGLRVVEADDSAVALRLLVDRRDELGVKRTKTVNQIHRLLLELVPGGAAKFLSAAQARALGKRGQRPVNNREF